MTEISRTVATALQSLRQRETTSRLSAELADVSQELSTGLKANPYDDLGYKSSDAIAIRMQVTRNDGFLTSNKLLDSRFLAVETSLGAMRDVGQAVLEQAMTAQSASGPSTAYLSQAARSTLDTIIQRAAVSDSSGYLMAGTRLETNPLQAWDEVNPATGFSPAGAVTDVIGGPMNSMADVQSAIDGLKAAFGDADPANPNRNFEATFYNGAPSSSPPLTSRTSETQTLSQNAQANDPAMRDLMRGLAMLSAVDANDITDPDAREVWLDEARSAISSGLEGLIDLETVTGLKRGQLQDTMAAQESRALFLDQESLKLEGADPYDAATRLTQLQNQLDSSYAVTARLSRLSFLNYL
jgi:flagellar hook-associated protein 3 FlgL